jgi:glutaconate CoA-transferase subunit B
VGVLSPIPGSAALLARTRSGGSKKVSIIGCLQEPYRIDGGVDLFDCAAQGRVDAFFLSGGQIDGQANINLTGIGSYPQMDVRWSGAFGSAYLYFLVPRVILFREEHSRRVFVPKVDFISAPGTSEPHVYRPGGPYALVTGLCVFLFDRVRARFRLASVHAGHSVEEVRDETGFEFDCPQDVAVTESPDAATLRTIRGEVAATIAQPYPTFAKRVWGQVAA